MPNKACIITFLAIAVFGMGCNKEQTSEQQMEKVKIETKEAAQDMKDYTFAEKDEFTKKMQGQLSEIDHDLDQLSIKIESSSDAMKAEAKPRLQGLRDKEAQLNKQLEEIKNATESTWDSVKANSKKAFNDLKDGFQQSRQWVSDKIAP